MSILISYPSFIFLETKKFNSDLNEEIPELTALIPMMNVPSRKVQEEDIIELVDIPSRIIEE